MLVPVRDDTRGIEGLLGSVPAEDYSQVEVLVNDDPRSLESLDACIARFSSQGLRVRLLRTNVTRAKGRIDAATEASGDIVVHLDADMELTSGLVDEVIALVDGGADAIVIPEVSFGTGYWARCKVLEKRCWLGDEDVEAARAMTVKAYWAVGGHDPAMVWSEDKDLDIRLRELPANMARTKAVLRHDERHPHFLTSVRKKARYATTASLFSEKHPGAFRRQRNPTRIAILLWRSARYSDSAWLVPGVVALKLGEFGAVAAVLLRRRLGWPTGAKTAT